MYEERNMALLGIKLLLVLFLVSHALSDKCFSVSWAPSFVNKKFKFGTRLGISSSSTIYHCFNECFQTFGCVAMNFGPTNSTHSVCELFDITRHYSMPDFIVSHNWTYMEREVGKRRILRRTITRQQFLC